MSDGPTETGAQSQNMKEDDNGAFVEGSHDASLLEQLPQGLSKYTNLQTTCLQTLQSSSVRSFQVVFILKV